MFGMLRCHNGYVTQMAGNCLGPGRGRTEQEIQGQQHLEGVRAGGTQRCQRESLGRLPAVLQD